MPGRIKHMFHITVMSRQQAVRFSHKPFSGETVAMISISTPETYYNNCPRRGAAIQKICYSEFYDITTEWADERTPAITEPIADHIARFIIDQDRTGIQHLIIHCDAGQSRSAGVARAIEKFYGMQKSEVKYGPISCPNMTVCDAVLNSLTNWYKRHNRIPPTEINAKEGA